MKPFRCIGENNEETIDLIELFEFAFDYKVDCDDVVIALSEIIKHVTIKEKGDNENQH